MDQRQTTEAELYERLFPGKDLPYWVGEALRYPVRDIPTVEDYERAQGLLGVPTEEQSSREVGQGALDYLTMAHGVASLLRGGTGAAQELMGTRRGAETFGKEMMDTSRRALPRKWQEQMSENWRRPEERDFDIASGRESFQGQTRRPFAVELPPGENPSWRRGESFPADVVQRGELGIRTSLRPDAEVYRIGEMVPLPGGREVQYVVSPGKWGSTVSLYDGQHTYVVEGFTSIGEALAKARQLQNRLALAAKDPWLPHIDRYNTKSRQFSEGAPGTPAGWKQGEGNARQTRFPWESGDQPWPSLYTTPPESGRWAR